MKHLSFEIDHWDGMICAEATEADYNRFAALAAAPYQFAATRWARERH